MNQYKCKVFNGEGQISETLVWADSEAEAVDRLQQQQFHVMEVTVPKNAGKVKKWRYKDISEFSYRMALLLQAGVPIRRVMAFLAERPHKRIPYQRIQEAVQRGRLLSDVMRSEGFPAVGCALLAAGEASGTLGDSFDDIRRLYTERAARQQQLRGAMAYPCFLLVLMLVFTGIAVGLILPSFEKVFATMHVPLPSMTKVLFGFGQAVRSHGLLLGGLTGLLVAFLVYSWQRPAFKVRRQQWWWHNGAGKEWFDCFYWGRMARIWALLLDGGLSIRDVLVLTEPLYDNVQAAALQQQVKERIEKGSPLTKAMVDCGLGNAFLLEMLTVGEETGEMVTMLTHCADYYDRLAAVYLKKWERLMEPMMISFMGIGVAVLVMAVMIPLFNSISAIQNI